MWEGNPPSGSPGHPASSGYVREGTVTKHKEVTTLLWMIQMGEWASGGEQGNRGMRARIENVGTILRWRMARRVPGGSLEEDRTERRGELLRWKEATKKGERGGGMN